MPELLARMLNCQLLLEEDKELRQFGADDIMPFQFITRKNQAIELSEKIYWLSMPANYKTCKNQIKDHFYCTMNFVDDELKINQMLFGDFVASDIEFNSWVKSEINWIYEFEY